MNRKTNTSAPSMFESLESRQLMAAGDLDVTFGAGGKVVATDTVGYEVADIAVQPDGKVVVVGSLNGNFAITRFNRNGNLDRSFGGGGFVRTDFGDNDTAHSVVVQPDGRIIVVGRKGIPIHFGETPDFAVVRLNPNGTPDRTFDGDGKLLIDFGSASGANAVALQPDGKILVAGVADKGGIFGDIDDEFAVARLLPNGTLDRTFGDRRTGPVATGRTGRTTTEFKSAPHSAEATMITAAPDGKILVGGLLNQDLFGLARFNSNGTIDKSYSDDGALLSFTRGSRFRDLHVSADGSATLVGKRSGNFLTARITKQGDFDTSFRGGAVETDLGGNDDARHVFVNGDGILVAGESSGKFALARLRLDGKLDTSFSGDGKVVTPAGTDDAILASTLSADGKLTVFGRSASSARFIAVAPTVNVFSLDPSASEAGTNNGSLIFTRDKRLSVSTRIFFDLGGSATLNTDYNGPSITQLFTTGNVQGSGQLAPVTVERVGFVDIAANETFTVVPINVLGDAQFEGAESVLASIRANAAYVLGNRPTQAVTIADDDAARINFQQEGAPADTRFRTDAGAVFGNRGGGLSFGWDADNSANARTRRSTNAPSFQYDTLNHMQKNGANRSWEFALPNGVYSVHLVMGDPSNTDSVYKVNIEGKLALSGTPTAQNRWIEKVVPVEVKDGRLTISNATGALNNRICFVEIFNPGAPASKGVLPVTGTATVRGLIPGSLSDLFSTKDIERLAASL